MPTDSKETQSKEAQSTPETIESLKKRIEELESKNKELEAENEKLKSKTDQWDLKEEIIINRLYRFWRSRLDKSEVDNILKNLNGEHKNKIEDFIKNDKIEDLQKYLNSLIDSWAINKDQLVNNCREKWIWLRDGHIFEDGKFWPQTFEAIKCLSSSTSEWWSEDGNKDKAKEGTTDWNKDKWKDGKEEYDYTKPIEWRDKRLYKAIKLASLDELPKNYKWPIPSNYEKWKEETYATVYHVYIKWKSEKPYIFYGNGTCRSPLDDQIYDSKAIVEKLKNGRADEKEYWNINTMKALSDVIKGIDRSYKLGILWLPWVKSVTHDVYYDDLATWEATKKITVSAKINDSGKYTTTLWVWDLLDKKWKFSESYFKNVLLKQAWRELYGKYEADKVVRGMKDLKDWYSMSEIFGNEHKDDWRYAKYFNEMDKKTKKITFDDISRDGTNIQFSLDNDGSNKDYNKLTASYTELVDNKGEFSQTKLKQYLKKKIEETIENHF